MHAPLLRQSRPRQCLRHGIACPPARHERPAMKRLPAWAQWNPGAAEAPWTVGIEEEVMLLDPSDWALASRIEDVLPALSGRVAGCARAETHGSAIELAGRAHATVAAAATELAALRAALVVDLAPLGLRA